MLKHGVRLPGQIKMGDPTVPLKLRDSRHSNRFSESFRVTLTVNRKSALCVTIENVIVSTVVPGKTDEELSLAQAFVPGSYCLIASDI